MADAPLRRGTLVQFGAGNIGRSFIGQLFGTNGYTVVFVEVDEEMVDEINRRGSYQVLLRETGSPEKAITVSGVSALRAADEERVVSALAHAQYVATAVGKSALPRLARILARGIESRRVRDGGPIDIILAENVRGAAATLRDAVESALGGPAPDVGFVETSIGKMVPIITEAEKAQDPLRIVAEPYNTLICDAKAFVGPLPEIPEILGVENIAAYVDRKLFVHNLGHAAAAYLGNEKNPDWTYLADAIAEPSVLRGVREAMQLAAGALAAQYPRDLELSELLEHIEDLLRRFRNRALADTIHRVGRDLPRKLAREDRVVGAMRLAIARRLDPAPIARVYCAALHFAAGDETGQLFPGDKEFHRSLRDGGLPAILQYVSGLDPDNPVDSTAMEAISRCFSPYRELSTTSAPPEASQR